MIEKIQQLTELTLHQINIRLSDIQRILDGLYVYIKSHTTSISEILNGTSRISFTKKIATSLTLTAGTSAETVTDLQVAHNGTFYHITEAAATPGINMYVEFTKITQFNWVNIIAIYDGEATHSVAIQLYNWLQARWDTFDACQHSQENVSTASGYILNDQSFFVHSCSAYINIDGKVRVRFYHTMAGNASHDLYIDVVALY